MSVPLCKHTHTHTNEENESKRGEWENSENKHTQKNMFTCSFLSIAFLLLYNLLGYACEHITFHF